LAVGPPLLTVHPLLASLEASPTLPAPFSSFPLCANCCRFITYVEPFLKMKTIDALKYNGLSIKELNERILTIQKEEKEKERQQEKEIVRTQELVESQKRKGTPVKNTRPKRRKESEMSDASLMQGILDHLQ